MIEKQNLAKLATKMRILRKPEKNKFLYELNEYAEDYHLNKTQHHFQDTFLPHRIASGLYYSLEGEAFVQSKFVSQVTPKDVRSRKKFEMLFAGVVAYRDASDDERIAFKKSVLKMPNPISKAIYLIKMRQNDIG